MVRTALSTADGGHLANLSRLCEQMLGDDRLPAVLETRVGGLLGLDLTFEESARRRPRRASGKTRRPRIVRALEDGDWWALFPEDEEQQILMWGLLLGVCPGRLVVDEDAVEEDGRLLPRVEFWHPQHLRWDPRSREWKIKVNDRGEEVVLTPGDGEWLLYTPFGRFRPWAHGLWRGLARWWLLKSYAIDDWGRHGENAARAVATSDQKSTKDQRRKLAAEIYEAGKDPVIVMPQGFDLKLVEATANTRDIYDAQVGAADKAFSIGVLGQNLTTDVEGGSFAAAKVHSKVEAQRIEADAEREATWARTQVLVWYAEWNYGNRDLAPWPLRNTEPPEDMVQKSEVLERVARAVAIFEKRGIPIDRERLRDDFGVPITDEGLTPTEPGQPEPGPKPPQQGDDPEDDPAPDDDDEDAEGGANNAARRHLRLASGDRIRNASGFVDGQTYADALVEHGVRAGADGLDAFLTGLLDSIDELDSIDDARDAIVAHYEGAMAPEQLADAAMKLFTLGELGGTAAMLQDAPEASE